MHATCLQLADEAVMFIDTLYGDYSFPFYFLDDRTYINFVVVNFQR